MDAFRDLRSARQLARNKPAGQVFGDAQAVAGDGDERGAVQRHHARLAEQAHSRRALGQHRRQRIRPQHDPFALSRNRTG